MTFINYRHSGQAGCIQRHTGVEVRQMELHIPQQWVHRQQDDMTILVQQLEDHNFLLVVLELVWWEVCKCCRMVSM